MNILDIFSWKKCSICQKNGINRFKIRSEGYCCRKCFKKTGLRTLEFIENMSAAEIVGLIAASNFLDRHEASARPNIKANKKITKIGRNGKNTEPLYKLNIIKPLIMFLAIPCILSIPLALRGFNYDNSPRYLNLQLFEEEISEELAPDIISALLDTGVLKNNEKLDDEDIIAHGNGKFEINVGIVVRLIISGDEFKLYTYKKEFDINTAILLYDSANESKLNRLTEQEYLILRISQRKHIIESTIKITCEEGIRNKYYSPGSGIPISYFKITFENMGEKTIKKVTISYSSKPNQENESHMHYHNTENYFALTDSYNPDKIIEPGESLSQEIFYSEWNFIEKYVLEEVHVYYTDGTSISFDSYDAKLFDLQK